MYLLYIISPLTWFISNRIDLYAYTMAKVYCTSFESKIGIIYLASTDRGVCKISIPKETKKDFFLWLHGHFDQDEVEENRSRNKVVIDELNRYFNRKLTRFSSPLHQIGTPFQKAVWRSIRRISYGSTLTYKDIAIKIGHPKAYQAVARANATNPIPIIIPCHRVIGANGSLVGYSAGVKTKEFLLALEGAIIV
jgi:methylated-DNA-[protein]-cysteine S-methyltransferase